MQILCHLDRPVVSSEWLKKCFELEEKVSLRKYLIGEAECIEDEENIIDQNSAISINTGSDNEANTQKFEKNTKNGENQQSTPSNNRNLIAVDPGTSSQ